ncbi:hypothetical protein IWQ62_004144 [Dispira parvispora]|uniref:Secreted protein n=1 Tax=Dispira parvispora TaxID=1520584 RepID=A0A9W8AMZ5_9FUNG|nr:hypothetical protein IWQ62_004144 [Dispira parvispora]
MKLGLIFAFTVCISGTFAFFCHHEADYYSHDGEAPRGASSKEQRICTELSNECDKIRGDGWKDIEHGGLLTKTFKSKKSRWYEFTNDHLEKGKYYEFEADSYDICVLGCVKDGYQVKMDYDFAGREETYTIERVVSSTQELE